MDCIKIVVPQKFDFKTYGIKKDSELEFLKKMCEDLYNKPIIQNEKPIGVILNSKLNETKDGIISEGVLWCNIEKEMTMDNNVYNFVGIVINDRFK